MAECVLKKTRFLLVDVDSVEVPSRAPQLCTVIKFTVVTDQQIAQQIQFSQNQGWETLNYLNNHPFTISSLI